MNGGCNCNNAKTIDVYVELAGREKFHESLKGRDEIDQHPISAITDLEETLEELRKGGNSYSKEEIDEKLSTVLRYKGTVSDFEALPVINNEVGDVYNVCQTGNNYVWTGNGWDNLCGTGPAGTEWATRDYVDGSVNNAISVTIAHMQTHFYEKDEIDKKFAELGEIAFDNALIYEGEVNTYAQLPKEDVRIGHLYYVKNRKCQYFWDGYSWQLVGAEQIDSYNKAEIEALLATKADKKDVEEALSKVALKEDVYTKEEIDNKIATNETVERINELLLKLNETKADKAEVYTKQEVYNKEEVYNKTEVDNMNQQLQVLIQQSSREVWQTI